EAQVEAPEAEPEPEPEVAKPEPEPEPEPEPPPEPPPELENEQETDVATAEPDPQPDPQPDPRPDTETEVAEVEPEQPDPATLSPRQRHPEGTLNPVATDIGMWGPEGAQSVMIIRGDRVRRSEHTETIRGIMGALPDFDTLLGGTDIDPFEDVDAMLIASTDIRYITRTFIATLHRLEPATLMEQLDGGVEGGVEWEDRDGRLYGTPRNNNRDPRVFLVPTSGLFIYSRPEFLEPVLSNAPRARGLGSAMTDLEARRAQVAQADVAEPRRITLRATLAETQTALEALAASAELGFNGGVNPCQGMQGPRGRRCRDDRDRDRRRFGRRVESEREALTLALATTEAELATLPARPALGRSSRTVGRADEAPPVRDDGWIRGLMEMADFGGDGPDGPAVVWTFQGLRSLSIDGMNGVAPPNTLYLTMTLDRDPVLAGRMAFTDEDAAQAWVNNWQNIVAANNGAVIRLSGLFPTLNEAEWSVDHNEAIFRSVISRSTMTRLSLTL
ncbi:MAG: hypothetical protein ACI82G_003331, partial [Bradymonadia bacterium]